MEKFNFKQALFVAGVSLLVVIVYNAAKDKYNASKTAKPATTTPAVV